MLSYFNFKSLKPVSLTICLFVMFSVFITLNATAKTYYISPSGNDTKGDGSISSPWETLIKAEQNVSAGDTVYCREGIWINHGRVNWNVDGTEAKPITIAAYPGETPVFSRIGYDNLFIYFDACKWIIIDGLEVEGYRQAFHPQGSPYTNDTSDTITDYAENITIRNCYLHDCYSHEIYVSAGCKNITIHNNRMEKNEQANFYCIQQWHNPAPDGLDIYNNILIGASGGIAVGHYNPENVRIYNNTIYDQTVAGIRFFGTYSNEMVIKNNIIYEPGNGVELIYTTNKKSTLAPLIFDHNLYYKTGSGNFAQWNGTTYSNFSNWKNSSGKDGNSNHANPFFVNTGIDFDLKSSSLAIDAGVIVGALTTDYEGNLRPQGVACDIGAYEYQGNISPVSMSVPVKFIVLD